MRKKYKIGINFLLFQFLRTLTLILILFSVLLSICTSLNLYFSLSVLSFSFCLVPFCYLPLCLISHSHYLLIFFILYNKYLTKIFRLLICLLFCLHLLSLLHTPSSFPSFYNILIGALYLVYLCILILVESEESAYLKLCK